MRTLVLGIILSIQFLLFSNPSARTEDSAPFVSSFYTGGNLINQELYVRYSVHFNQSQYYKILNEVGMLHPINSTVRQVSRLKNKLLFDVSYEIDELGLRDLPRINLQATNHFIVAGDSNTFGVGVKDEETLSYILSKRLHRFNSYNYGMVGSGPNNTLRFMEVFPWEKKIKESRGKMIYLYYQDWMIERFIGANSFIKWSHGKGPWYELNENEDLVYRGSFNSSARTFLLKIINHIDFFNLVGVLPKPKVEHMRLLSKIFSKMKFEYNKKFPLGEFIIGISLESAKSKELLLELEKYLVADKISFIHIHKKTIDPKTRFEDFHFNKLGQQDLAAELLKEINFNL